MINDLDLHETSFRGRSLGNVEGRGGVYAVMWRKLYLTAAVSCARTGMIMGGLAVNRGRKEHLRGCSVAKAKQQ